MVLDSSFLATLRPVPSLLISPNNPSPFSKSFIYIFADLSQRQDLHSRLLSRKGPEGPPCSKTGSPARSAVARSAEHIYAGTRGAPPASPTRPKGRVNARLEELATKGKAQLQGFKCPSCSYDYGPFARPFFEGAKRRRLSLECAACFQRFVLGRDGSTYPIN